MLVQGRDPQLERVVEEVMRMLRENPPVMTPAPPLEDRWARGQKLATQTSVALEDVARELGFGTIYSSTATEDSLYHKLGYRTTGQNPHHEYTVFLIRKEL